MNAEDAPRGIGAVAARIVWAGALSAVFTWVFLKAGTTLLAPLLLHASINAVGDFSFPGSARAMAFFFLFLILGVAAAVDLRLRAGPSARHASPGRTSEGPSPRNR